MNNRELIALIDSEGFELDWHEIDYECNKEIIDFQEDLYKKLKEHKYKGLLDIGFSKKHLLSDSIKFLGDLSSSFTKELSRNPDLELLREKIVVKLKQETIDNILNSVPYIIGSEYINVDWIKAIWYRLNNVFSEEIKEFDGSISDYFSFKNSKMQPVGRVFFHLVENKGDDYPFAFLSTYSRVNKEGKSKHLPLKNALIEYKDDNNKLLNLLSTVNKAAGKSHFISELLDSGDIFHPIGVSLDEAYTFLKEVPIYEEAGVLCRIPNWWKNKSDSIRLSVNIGENNPSRVGYDSILDFNLQLSLGGENISPDELRTLMTESEGLALIKGKWVEVDHEKLKKILDAYENANDLMNKSEFNLIDAMKLKLNASKIIDIDEEACDLEISNGKWLNNVLSCLKKPDNIKSVDSGDNFKAVLRKYQHKGLNWLNYMKNLGLGACLADDMGLGKTIQVIALLNNIRQKREEKTLLIVPASLMSNWVSEIIKFAPSLKYYVLHSSENKISEDEDKDLLDNYDIFITTYGMVSKLEWLKTINWDSVILDEAQAIKNPGTKQTRSVKQIKAKYRLALTGTPIENRLSDLWSLFDFLNKGLLGNKKEFSDFVKRLKEHHEGYSRLKNVVSPFIIRRLKTDKEVIKDLPDKIEMKTYASLTKRQAAIYESFVNSLKYKLEQAEEGIERKGLVLSSLIKLKQICNHPDQYLGQDMYDEDESGKYNRLREICKTIYEKRERVLVFTQFREIINPLKDFLEKIFQHEGLALHGGTPVAKRKKLVERFQSKDYVPFMVLSIKAGGVGLNLTSANHVIHFDRWWNPAVENQATDRAFRIGQNKNVIVHKFITKGTIEEKIDLMIEDKVKLQNEIVPDMKENWITEMDNNELMELFSID